MLKLVITVTCLSAVAAIAEAQSGDLTGQEIAALVAGATIEIDTPVGSKLPISYTADGHLHGQARQLALYLGAGADRGRWWVASNQLCHAWEHWFNSEPQCLRLRRDGRKLQWWRENGQHGTAVLTAGVHIQTAAVAAAAEHEAKLGSALATTLAAPSQRLATALPAEDKADAGERSRTAPEQAVTPAAQEQAPSMRPAPPAAKRAADPAYKVANVERDDVLNVRSGPSTEFDVIAALPPESRGVTMTGACQLGWCPVQHQSTRGWVNRTYLAIDGSLLAISATPDNSGHDNLRGATPLPAARDPADAPRTCLTPPARALLQRIEETFGPVRLVSTCRRGAIIAGTTRPSRHASGNAVDFDAGARKAQIVEWLVANHHEGGTMTYADMDHIHVDIGPHFVSIAGGLHWASWRNTEPHFPIRVGPTNASN